MDFMLDNRSDVSQISFGYTQYIFAIDAIESATVTAIQIVPLFWSRPNHLHGTLSISIYPIVRFFGLNF